MEKKNIRFTNEEITKKFKSRFELVNYAIKLAENMIMTGRKSRVDENEQNPAMCVIKEIAEGKDTFEDIETSTNQEGADGYYNEEIKEVMVFDTLPKGKNAHGFSIEKEE